MKEEVNFDYQLTPYKIQGLTKNSGFVEFVEDSKTIREILEKEKSIENYFKKKCQNNIEKENQIIRKYMCSCAGYCVITYLLGIGDRHLDNLMVSSEGKMFHIDFGYILGNDCKLFPSEIKITEDMIKPFRSKNQRGENNYILFVQKCVNLYNYLRNNSQQFINLLLVFQDSDLSFAQQEFQKRIKELLQKFKLDLTEQEAAKHFFGVINESLNAIWPAVNDYFHNLAIKWKS
ncbi:phosphoinositide-3-kinase subunit, putative [Ichthyophthirius multifiliis]|uniref:Phosphoinositide-3-kinase subunit, putative n=1 Tax=Ichthyophthirius multifiliis TaxID=5932 RepID=G0QKP1_ICHMU|nr:phosphoinositide-3-kinase subunit, putative [Ichthyophthirius multifiliis]EGR34216.1 phosphoinositide-3-kinase subunit, putative [Ichthyophthirius multifiliis]|eukprot:XP_004039520.1 phosphoinositide-3-kinase subunit, putative [Ichthyophthirius multifiliis]